MNNMRLFSENPYKEPDEKIFKKLGKLVILEKNNVENA